MGIPQIPKPPTRRKELLVIPLMAYWGVVQILEKSCQGLESKELNMILNNLFISPSKQCTRITNPDNTFLDCNRGKGHWRGYLPLSPAFPIILG
jgi:hypothetical protein